MLAKLGFHCSTIFGRYSDRPRRWRARGANAQEENRHVSFRYLATERFPKSATAESTASATPGAIAAPGAKPAATARRLARRIGSGSIWSGRIRSELWGRPVWRTELGRAASNYPAGHQQCAAADRSGSASDNCASAAAVLSAHGRLRRFRRQSEKPVVAGRR